MSLVSSSLGRVRCLSDDEADHNMLQDLHLAAELGKTLLERNKELENCIKAHQCTIDDQAQEIEYMKKQTACLREVNDSRIRVYEQLEVSIQDLERANQRLVLENGNDKKQIKSHCTTIDNLEARIDELQKKYDEIRKKYETLMQERQQTTKIKSSEVAPTVNGRASPMFDGSTRNMAVSPRRLSPDEELARIHQTSPAIESDESVTRLLQQLSEVRGQRARDQKRVEELKEQVESLMQEHAQMDEQIAFWKSKARDTKNLQDEINTLEEVRQGHLCKRCLRGIGAQTQDELSVLHGEEDDELSLAESLADSFHDADTTLQESLKRSDLSEENRARDSRDYRELVEKYEALMRMRESSELARARVSTAKPSGGGMSLQEELQMSGEFGSGRGGAKKPLAATPTDFSEAETSSSGFSDETSNKATQTEGRPGSFLCSIADGDDCKLSIYDDSSSFESRFHKTPEYRKLFSEIFGVLKRAAEAKEEGAELSLLEELPGQLLAGPDGPDDAPSEATDDARSVASLAVSSVASEPVFRVHSPLFAKRPEQQQQHQQHQQQHQQQHSYTRRQPLEYVSVQSRKKAGGKKPKRHEHESEPGQLASPNPRVRELKGGARRSKFRPLTASEMSDGLQWNGQSAHFYPSKSPRGKHQQHNSSFARDNFSGSSSHLKSSLEYKPGSAAEEVAKLRRLEMSYAEVLRMPNKPNSRHRRNH